MNKRPIGVLGLQGDVSEHVGVLEGITGDARVVKKASDLDGIRGLIIPGGESTTLLKLLKKFKLDREIRKKNLPVFGTCAGAVLLSREILNIDQSTLNLMDISIERNGYGRQAESFEADLEIPAIGKKAMRGVFIRAPIIKLAGAGVDILSEHNGSPVLVRQGNVLASTFHPELSGDDRLHKYFLDMLETD